jgi:hypothetical protein
VLIIVSVDVIIMVGQDRFKEESQALEQAQKQLANQRRNARNRARRMM